MNKPVKVWLYVILSCLPFVGIYPLIKLKKTRKMFLMDTIAILLGYGIAALLLEKGISLERGALLPIYASILFLYIGGAFSVYGWSKEHNKKLLSNTNQ